MPPSPSCARGTGGNGGNGGTGGEGTGTGGLGGQVWVIGAYGRNGLPR
ncbi:hypothetical protein [Mycobacterium bourgelatii]|nr:hypothetical protein [Mycobacterium bourgelatii]MCV6973885.1 hypothetical protein [Mycobacterium bourgelatii]